MSRIITAVIVLPFLIASILVPWLQPLFVVLAAAAMVLGLYEFYLLREEEGHEAGRCRGLSGAARRLFTIFYFASRDSDAGSSGPAINRSWC